MALKVFKNFGNQGPCDPGFHIPTNGEFSNSSTSAIAGLLGMLNSLGIRNNTTTYTNYLLIPPSYYLNRSGGYINDHYGIIRLWTCTAFSAFSINENDNVAMSNDKGANCFNIRAFKDTPVIPDSSWTVLYDGGASNGIFHNTSLGLISISHNGKRRITIQDHNVGATTVWYPGDTIDDTNAGLYYQRGNNYGFPRSGPRNFRITQVGSQITNYGPDNPYCDSYFVSTTSNNRYTSTNNNLRGGYDASYTGMVIPTDVLKVQIKQGQQVHDAKCVFKGSTLIWPPSIQKIILNDNDLSLLPGNTFLLKTKLLPYAAQSSITFSSTNSSIATVNSDGLVTAVSEGNATIVASTDDPSIYDVCNVSVEKSNMIAKWTFNGSTYDELGNYSLSNMTTTQPTRYNVVSNSKVSYNIYNSSSSLLRSQSAPSWTKGTVSMYFKPSSSSFSGTLICQGNDQSDYNTCTYFYINSSRDIYIKNGSQILYGIYLSSPLSTTRRNNITITQDGTYMIIYLNGNQVASENIPYWLNYSSGSYLYVGTHITSNGSPTEYLKGYIGDTALRSNALTSAQVSAYVDATKTPYGIS